MRITKVNGRYLASENGLSVTFDRADHHYSRSGAHVDSTLTLEGSYVGSVYFEMAEQVKQFIEDKEVA